MLKRKENKKKKGFTLIELVIVLAVLAIIALIAIPNFTKVRNNSKVSADIRTAEQIEKITQMAIADDIVPIAENEYTVADGGKVTGFAEGNTKKADFENLLRSVKKPQDPGATGYTIAVTAAGDVSVKYTGKPTLSENKWLAGANVGTGITETPKPPTEGEGDKEEK